MSLTLQGAAQQVEEGADVFGPKLSVVRVGESDSHGAQIVYIRIAALLFQSLLELLSRSLFPFPKGLRRTCSVLIDKFSEPGDGEGLLITG